MDQPDSVCFFHFVVEGVSTRGRRGVDRETRRSAFWRAKYDLAIRVSGAGRSR